MNEKDKLTKIDELLTRGVEDVFIKEHLKEQLLSGKKLRVKLGFDPTGPKIHIGRAIVLRKLKAFQDLGHQIVFIIGDYTATIGDASDKTEKRPMLSREEVNENFKDYKNQIGKIIDMNNVEIVYNSDWLGKLSFFDLAELAECFSVQQMQARRNFKERLERGDEISLREFLYPLLQGYDSFAVRADVEIGGFDQLFNLKAGRIVQKHFGMPEQDIMNFQMLEGTDGRKMSTSWGNIITIVDEPNDMYGKIMTVRDDLIIKYFTLCTDVSLEEIKNIEKEIAGGANPRDAKMRLAREIVNLYHPAGSTEKAEADFIAKFQKKEIPDDVLSIEVKNGAPLKDVLIENGLVKSGAEFRRLVEAGAIKEGEDVLKDPDVKIDHDAALRVGKHRFVRINIK